LIEQFFERWILMMWRTIFGILAVGASLVGGTTAHADTVDDQFINQLSARGITGDRGQLIGDGHAACDNYGSPGLVGFTYQIMGQGFSNGQAGDIISVAWHTYCQH
jgi:hypothetical protein